MLKPRAGMLNELRRFLEPVREGTLLEWGPGATTFVLAECAQSVTTIEHELAFYTEAGQAFVGRPNITLHLVGLDGARRSECDEGLAYSTFPLGLPERPFDAAVIDGRRRLECAFVAALVVRPQGLVLLHDYRRERYQAILQHPALEHLASGEHFRALRVRSMPRAP